MNKELIHLRSIWDLSQAELAERVGVHQTIISKIEKGVTPLQHHTEKKLMEVFSFEVGMQNIVLLNSVFEDRKMKTVKKDWKGV